MSLSFTEKLGFLSAVTEFMEKNAENLKQAGFNTDIRLQDQKTKNSLAVSQNERQDALKAELHKQTITVEEAMRDAYVTASGNMDAMAGVLMKDSEQSKILRQLRSKIRKGHKEQNKQTVKQ